jgi:hypothetical protein
MKKLYFSVVMLGLLMLAALPVIASDASDLNYMNDIRSQYMDKINTQGQTMIFDDVRLVQKGSPYSFPLTVGMGNYEIWGVGGIGIRNLNIRIYSADGSLLAENSETGNYPVVSFTESKSRSHRVEVSGSEFESGISQGYYLLIVVKTN